MTQPPARRRILFRDVAVGQRFYDPISAEYFVKQDDLLAAMVTGIGDGSVPDEFEGRRRGWHRSVSCHKGSRREPAALPEMQLRVFL
jgi:hypothetical protein